MSLPQLIQASGPEGRIIARDVESYVPSAAPPPGVGAPVPAPGASYSDIPLTGMRKVGGKVKARSEDLEIPQTCLKYRVVDFMSLLFKIDTIFSYFEIKRYLSGTSLN